MVSKPKNTRRTKFCFLLNNTVNTNIFCTAKNKQKQTNKQTTTRKNKEKLLWVENYTNNSSTSM